MLRKRVNLMKKILAYAGRLGLMFLALILYGELEVVYFYPNRLDVAQKPVVIAIFTVIVLAIMFAIYRWELKKENNWGFNMEPHWDWKRLGISLIGTVLITISGAVVLNLVSSGNGLSANQAALDEISKTSGRMFPILVVFLGPVCEETIFRGMFFNVFFTQNNRINKWLGIIVSGLVFGVAHDPGFSKYILVYWVLGMILAWVYLRTKDLRYSMITHMLYNALGFI